MCALFCICARWWKSKRRISNLLNFLSLHLPTKYFHVVQRHWKMNWLVRSCKSLRCFTQKKKIERETWQFFIVKWMSRNDDEEILLLIIIHVLHMRVSINDIPTWYYVNKRLEKEALESWFQCERVKEKGTEFKHKLTRVGASNNFVVLVRRKLFPFFFRV